MTLSPSGIGYVVKDYGLAIGEMFVGDTSLNMEARGFFAFDLNTLAEREINSAILILDRPEDETRGDPAFKGKVLLYFNDYLPIGRDDYTIHSYKGVISFANNEVPLEYSGEYLKNIIQERIGEEKKLQFALAYENSSSDDNNDQDGRYYDSEDIDLVLGWND